MHWSGLLDAVSVGDSSTSPCAAHSHALLHTAAMLVTILLLMLQVWGEAGGGGGLAALANPVAQYACKTSLCQATLCCKPTVPLQFFAYKYMRYFFWRGRDVVPGSSGARIKWCQDQWEHWMLSPCSADHGIFRRAPFTIVRAKS